MSIENKVIDESVQGEATLYPVKDKQAKNGKKLYLESYGCQMNFSDLTPVHLILITHTGSTGFTNTLFTAFSFGKNVSDFFRSHPYKYLLEL